MTFAAAIYNQPLVYIAPPGGGECDPYTKPAANAANINLIESLVYLPANAANTNLCEEMS